MGPSLGNFFLEFLKRLSGELSAHKTKTKNITAGKDTSLLIISFFEMNSRQTVKRSKCRREYLSWTKVSDPQFIITGNSR